MGINTLSCWCIVFRAAGETITSDLCASWTFQHHRQAVELVAGKITRRRRRRGRLAITLKDNTGGILISRNKCARPRARKRVFSLKLITSLPVAVRSFAAPAKRNWRARAPKHCVVFWLFCPNIICWVRHVECAKPACHRTAESAYRRLAAKQSWDGRVYVCSDLIRPETDKSSGRAALDYTVPGINCATKNCEMTGAPEYPNTQHIMHVRQSASDTSFRRINMAHTPTAAVGQRAEEGFLNRPAQHLSHWNRPAILTRPWFIDGNLYARMPAMVIAVELCCFRCCIRTRRIPLGFRGFGGKRDRDRDETGCRSSGRTHTYTKRRVFDLNNVCRLHDHLNSYNANTSFAAANVVRPGEIHKENAAAHEWPECHPFFCVDGMMLMIMMECPGTGEDVDDISARDQMNGERAHTHTQKEYTHEMRARFCVRG